jgi:DNA-binding GntR family transcriptional regulator
VTDEGKKESILNALKEQIQRGDFGTRGRIPTIAQLAKTHGVARTTIYQVLESLLIEGILISKDNSYYVNYPPMRIPGAPVFDKYLESQGLTPAVDSIVGPEIIAMPDEIADLFKATKGIHVVHLVRRHGTTDIPMRIAENWYPVELAKQFLEAMRSDPSLNVAGEIRKAHGLSIAKVSEDLIGRLPIQQEMDLLSIVRYAPVLEARRTFLTSDGKVILYNKTILVAAFFSLHYDYDVPIK